jgi:preprotein translocase subunit SecG
MNTRINYNRLADYLSIPLVWEVLVSIYLNIGLIITSIALIASVILQSKGAGLGGLTGGDSGGVFSARRGVEKTLFRITIALSVLFFGLAIASVIITI